MLRNKTKLLVIFKVNNNYKNNKKLYIKYIFYKKKDIKKIIIKKDIL